MYSLTTSFTLFTLKISKRFNKRFDLINKFSILHGVKYFSSGLFQNYSLFIPAKNYMKYFSCVTGIELWKSNKMSEENIENITNLDSNFAPTFADHHVLPDINFHGHYLIDNIYIPKKGIDI